MSREWKMWKRKWKRKHPVRMHPDSQCFFLTKMSQILLDLLKMPRKWKQYLIYLPNGGLMVIYHGRKEQIALNKSNYFNNMLMFHRLFDFFVMKTVAGNLSSQAVDRLTGPKYSL